MKYVERTEAPALDNPCYYSNENALYRDGYGMPNCTCYSLGRWIELLNYIPDLCLGNAGRWYGYIQDGYKRGNIPKLGAIACWGLNGSDIDGHVAIVEDFKDGYIYCSNSAYKSTNFYMKYYYGNYDFGSYVFKGFIYNPIDFDNNNGIQNDALYKVNSNIGLYLLDESGKIIKAYPDNTIVNYLGDGYNKYGYHYYKVSVNGVMGYMASSYLTLYQEPKKEENITNENTNQDQSKENTNNENTNQDQSKEETSNNENNNSVSKEEISDSDNKQNIIKRIIEFLVKLFKNIFKLK